MHPSGFYFGWKVVIEDNESMSRNESYCEEAIRNSNLFNVFSELLSDKMSAELWREFWQLTEEPWQKYRQAGFTEEAAKEFITQARSILDTLKSKKGTWA